MSITAKVKSAAQREAELAKEIRVAQKPALKQISFSNRFRDALQHAMSEVHRGARRRRRARPNQ